MLKKFFAVLMAAMAGSIYAQQIKFEEYDLPNGLHVILHQDDKVPVVNTTIVYHVGAKNEDPQKTGFAHFFEHLLFEGTKNIPRGGWDKLVDQNGGTSNANTTNDRTLYYLTFPSNNEELMLWMESERMKNAVINQIGVDTQRDVIKQEKKVTMDNVPYGNVFTAVQDNLFSKHPYKWSTIGSMEHLDKASLDDFKNFYKTFYVPNNATLVVAGNIKPEQTKAWISKYFSNIPKGKPIQQPKIKEDDISTSKVIKYVDPNIQLPAYIWSYRIPSNTKEAYALAMISAYLSEGKSSVLYKKLVDKGIVNEMQAFPADMEDYGIFTIFALPMGNNNLQSIQKIIDAEIIKLQKQPITEKELQKLQNLMESSLVKGNTGIEKIAESLATLHVLKGNTQLINSEIDIYKSITREDIQNAAKKYLNPNQRIVINYLPK